MFLEMSTEVASIRVYDEPDGYARRAPYTGMMNVTFLNSTSVYLHGARGVINRAIYDEAMTMLKALGVQEVTMERHGKMKTTKI